MIFRAWEEKKNSLVNWHICKFWVACEQALCLGKRGNFQLRLFLLIFTKQSLRNYVGRFGEYAS